MNDGFDRSEVALWPGTPPHVGTGAGHVPSLTAYVPTAVARSKSALLILPGGAYTFLSPKSGDEFARWFASQGITAFVVNFRLGADGYHHPALLADACQALCVVRSRAVDWQLDPARVGVVGTSAGGHLASMLVTGAAFDGVTPPPGGRPALGVLCYPVISLLDPIAHEETRNNFLGDDAGKRMEQERFSAELRVDRFTPPCFLWHTYTDEEVSWLHTERFAAALRRHRVPHELHLYGHGPHALGLARAEGLGWAEDCLRWLLRQGV